ncbi:hypothetical protein [Agitococcus lubricus]|uniref:Uncharacterized protein n=1 Tax=Agitococcus lubricus TaxID=1077255 RepID=A0A2T5IZG6_9GAMM|nr:hypothetical protein [Agitococcus lubricus]PTQ89346.1 hypothetical protein C8N29_10779 [Agitococcus lubricus]
MNDDNKYSLMNDISESWEDLEKLVKQKAEQTLNRLDEARLRLDDAIASAKAAGHESAREAVKEAKEAFKLAKSDWMRVKVETSIADLREQTEKRLQVFAESLEKRREQEIEKNVEALRRRLLQRDEDRIAAKRVKEAGKVEASVEKLLNRLESIEKKTEDSVPAASIALQLGLQVSKQVGMGKLARRAARQADELSVEVNKTLREVLPRHQTQKKWDTQFPEDEELS